MSRFADIDQAGKVLCTYNDGANEDQDLKVEFTKVPVALALFYTFLPAGFPHTVTEDYLAYQTYDSLQAFSSSITSLLANRAVLEGLGVGDAGQSPTAALLLQITRDTFSRMATILFAHRMGQAIEPECKFYRFLADLLNDAGQFLDLFVPVLPYFPKVGVMVTASVLRSLCGVAAGASKASLSAHFAKTGNLAELNAKEASQETIVSLFGMLCGTLLVRIVEDKTAVWCWMVILLGIHLAMNYRAVRCVRMRSLNRQRATIVFREWLETGTILTPAEVACRESILRGGRGAMKSKSGDYSGTCEFGSYGEVMGWRPWGYHRYVFETPQYFMGIFHWGPRFYVRIALKEGVAKDGRLYDDAGNMTSVVDPDKVGGITNGPLLAWFDAVNHAYHFDTALRDGIEAHYESELPNAGYVPQETKETVLQALKTAGWDVEAGALETKSPVRVRCGETKKAAPIAEKPHQMGPEEMKHD